MTPTERRRCLDTIGWDQRQYARRIGWDEGTVRRWMRGEGPVAPEELDDWLIGLCFLVENYPAPPRRGQFPRSTKPKLG